MNRYDEYVRQNELEITRLTARIERFRARGVRLEAIPDIERQIEELRSQIPNLRGTAKLVREKYGD